LATLEHWADDIVTVMNAVGSERAAIVGAMTGVPITVLFAATHPRRAATIVLINPGPAIPYGDQLSFGNRDLDEAMDAFRALWGTPRVMEVFAPSMAGDETFASWFARFCRMGNPPTMATQVMRAQLNTDLRQVFGTVQAPTLVVQRSSGSGLSAPSHGRLLLDGIPSARLVEVPGEDFLPYVGDTTALLDEIERFVTGDRPRFVGDRVLATVLFTDIVASTQRAVELGDRTWRTVLEGHHEDAKDRIADFGGRFIKTTGDGILATFDGPSRAIHCARGIRDAAKRTGLEVRAGLHTGEVEVMSDDIGGVAVHVAARVLAHAGASEVLVSSSVPPLVAGSGIGFDHRGEHELRGIPGSWTLFLVTT
jgi:class 3 adenylate cyclase